MSSSPTEAGVQVVMPQMGVSVAEGTVVAWLKAPGDAVAADETICEVTTDKIDVEIPAPVAGRLTAILVDVGETVAVGTVLAAIATGASEPAAEEPAPAPAPTNGVDGGAEIDRSRFHSPVVLRIAGEHGIDLDAVEGHGVGGRVRKADLLALIEGGGPAKPERPLHSESPYRPEPESSRDVAGIDAPPEGESLPPTAAATVDDLLGPTHREPLSPMRRAIARHMLASRRTSAHCTTIVEADFSAAAARRQELAGRRDRPTYLAFVARAVVTALERYPVLNASIDADELVLHEDVNLGIAVALEDGLVVPVIRRAQRLSLEGMAAEIADVASRAREGRLEPDDTHGGTFTITNPGQFGAILATPIINQPQVAILDLEAVVKRPVAVAGADGGDAIAVRPIGNLCMSWDHRALDGAVAARFLADVRERVESAGRE
ncbi:MAG: 2-oxo acid dehydrogenase subunit E2 [Actinomycetota bacterium]|nr:2-oxo acid dehydrogenase subunit E2 [Actinomycetota bacterium]